jgi:phosphoribosyl 1,2-cyclic phosphodiesterase
VGPFTLTSFPTPHDSEESVGYRITVNDGDHTHILGYATDLGQVTPAVEQALCGCEGVVLECNHDEEMLMTGPYPADLKRRIASRNGHLSNAACAAFCAKLAATGMKRLMLAHLSEINNLPDLALSEVSAALAGTDVHVCVASPDQVTAL